MKQIIMQESFVARSVWMITRDFYPGFGGAERQIQVMSRGLMAGGWPVQVITRRHGFDHLRGLPRCDTVDGIPIYRLYSRGRSPIGAFLYILSGLWHLIWHGRQGIFHAHDVGSPGWLAVAARYLLQGRCVIKLRTDRRIYEEQRRSWFAHWRFSMLLCLTDLIVVVNRDVKDMLLSWGISAKKVLLIPNSVDIGSFYPSPTADKSAVRAKLDMAPEKTTVLDVGRLERVKGVDVLLRAWALLPVAARLRSQLVLVGDGSERDLLNGIIDSLEINESVTLVGERSSVLEYYWSADIFILPSRAEGLSNALIEAMACELPVIVSNVGGSLDVVRDGENGAIFESEDQDGLAQKIESLIAAPDEVARIGPLARQTVAKIADADGIVTKFSNVYADWC